jgi:paraquat-inducible protein A
LRPRQPALDHILGGAFATVILVISALFFPFLQISAGGLKSSTTLIETALTFNGGLTSPLSIALIIVIIVLPVARAILLSYAVIPLRFGWKMPPHARTAFHLAKLLRPWAMVEVFIVGVVVALVKIGGLASVGLGPAFWELLLILLIVALETSSLCEKTVWRMMQIQLRS